MVESGIEVAWPGRLDTFMHVKTFATLYSPDVLKHGPLRTPKLPHLCVKTPQCRMVAISCEVFSMLRLGFG